IIVRLIPKPPAQSTLLASFSQLVASGKAITNILAAGILPSAMEMMDDECIRAVENYSPSGLPLDAEAIIIIEVDGHASAVEEEIMRCKEICEDSGAMEVIVATDEAEREKVWKARRMVSPAITQIGPTKISEDATVPRSKIPEMMERLRE